MQALAGVLLPSATVFLVLLCNDRPVLGPWVNTFRQSATAWVIVWTLLVLSLVLTAVTFFPKLSTVTLVSGAGIGAGLGIAGGAMVFAVGWFSGRRDTTTGGRQSVGCADPGSTRAERKAMRDTMGATRTMPALAMLDRPVMSPVRLVGLLTLRIYLVLACILVVVKIVQVGVVDPASSM